MLNVRPGQKAQTILPSGTAMVGAENAGIIVIVDGLVPPGQSGVMGEAGPIWAVTSLGRPFIQYRIIETPIGVVVNMSETSQSAHWPDRWLKPILDDKPEVKEEERERELVYVDR